MIIPPIDLRISDGVAAGIGNIYAHQLPALEVIITDAERSGARILLTSADVRRTDIDGKSPRDYNTSIRPPRLTSPVMIVGGTTVYPTSSGSQDIISPKGSIGPQEVRDSQPLDTSIHGIYAEHMDPAPTWSKLIGRKLSK